MPSIKSDLTNKTYPEKQMRNFTVPDESEPLYDYSQDQGPPPDANNLSVDAINQRLASRGLPPLDGVGLKAVEARNAMKVESVREFENKIAGTDTEMFLGDPSVEAVMEFLEELDEPVLSRLYAAYVELVNETNEKYAIKNEADVQEVAADLKK
ncbi:unnamed protein product [Sphagnum jensenii]|uniref:Uncharacterized protein n=1 Tax=Sphagnum jensenii TaxID=128206 RepID=A0ABP0VE19_9BRYO